MKKIIILFSILFVGISTNAQKKKANPSNDCYVDTATAQFNLSENNKVTLNKFLAEREKDRAAVLKKLRATEITKQYARTQMRAINQKYFTSLSNLTAESKKVVMEFEKEVRKKCK
ncbi:hypothetical protein [Wenyingzhuangia sp. 2_MG-2023]|uniref:hypothetical protein n=1 Tax=Wenyingzhuangia sp. 2_MG-2023 TaxID=3062639 RepID=UPI0026E45F50|nr:hypothetical protein [Wenyingzhuangia sp. 2_MG-2023]MDO6737750.1 hypothetical protein [Wenyingzhuangia sp. 2_MG-2023]